MRRWEFSTSSRCARFPKRADRAVGRPLAGESASRQSGLSNLRARKDMASPSGSLSAVGQSHVWMQQGSSQHRARAVVAKITWVLGPETMPADSTNAQCRTARAVLVGGFDRYHGVCPRYPERITASTSALR